MKKIGIVKFLPEIAMMLTGGFITVSVLNPDFKIQMPKIDTETISNKVDEFEDCCTDKYDDIKKYIENLDIFNKKEEKIELDQSITNASNEESSIVEEKEEISENVLDEEVEVEVVYDEYTDSYLLDQGYEFRDIDFDSLNEENSDCIGYIDFPDTKVDFPVYQGNDNEAYLHNNASGQRDAAGEIYIDTRVDTSLGDDSTSIQNTTIPIYGHNMRAVRRRLMFHDMRYFADQSYVDEHPYGVYYGEDGDVYALEVVAAFNDASGVDSNIMVYNLDFQEYFDEYVSFINDNSLIKTDVSLELGDKIVNLVTCSYGANNERLVVVCKAVKQYTNEEQITNESENVKKLTK